MNFHSVSQVAADARSVRLLNRIHRAKRAFTTRHVDFSSAERLVRNARSPKAGDLVLARVTGIGQHARIENIHGRRGQLYVGDEIIVAFGNRYAPDQFEAHVPEALGACDLVAGGGVAAVMACKHAAMKAPTRIETIGLFARADGSVLNLAEFSPAPLSTGRQPGMVLAVSGSSMNAGKTTTAAGVVHGLTRAGFRVGAAKLTGTGSGGDLWTMRDAGAVETLDFTDAGHASTAGLDDDALAAIADRLLAGLAAAAVDVAVVEIADGLLQRETASLITMSRSRGWFDCHLFAAADAMAAAFGCQWLAGRGIEPVAVSGLLSASPLASAEASRTTGIPVVTLDMLRDPVAVTKIAFAGQPKLQEVA